MLSRAEHLPDADRVLIEQFLGQGYSISQLARFSGTPVRQMHRRVHSVIKRLQNKDFIAISTQFELLPKESRPTARMVVLNGMSMRRAAEAMGLSLHQVRKHMDMVHATVRLFQ